MSFQRGVREWIVVRPIGESKDRTVVFGVGIDETESKNLCRDDFY